MTYKELTYSPVAVGKRSDKAYAVYAGATFIGYAVGRDGGWSGQPEIDPAVPVQPTHEFVYAYPSRRYVAEQLAEEAKTAGVI